MKKVFYFAYGSNLLLERITWRLERLGSVKKHSTHRLYGWKLVFNCGFGGKNNFANIVPASTPTEYVEGVLYEISARQLKELDIYEGFYLKQFFDVPGGIAAVYIGAKNCITEGKPSLDYLNIIMDGCVENNFEKTLKELIAFKEKNYRLKRNRHKSLI